MIKQTTDFLDGNTTFSSTFEKSKSTEFPTILACFNPPLKSEKDVKTKNGKKFTMHEDYMFFKQNQDYFTEFQLFDRKKEKIGSKAKIDYFATQEKGLCIKVMLDVKLQDVSEMVFMIDFNSTNGIRPNQVDFFLASKDSWQGLILNKWPFFQVQQVSVKLKKDIHAIANLGLRQTRLDFLNGVDDFSQCLKESFEKNGIDCLPKNIFDSFSNLTICQDKTDQIIDLINDLDQVMNCFRPKSTYLFDAVGQNFDENSLPSWRHEAIAQIWITPYSGTLEVKKEILVLDASTFIGSIGGSLSLFLGFSIFSYLSGLIDWIVEKINQNCLTT